MFDLIDKNLLKKIFNSNEFKAWLISKRWFGDKSSLSTLNFEVKVNYFKAVSPQIYICIVGIVTNAYSKQYFLPLIRYNELYEILEPKERNREVLISLTEKSFSKVIALTTTEKLEDQVLSINLVEAEYCALFWRKLLFDKKVAEILPSLSIDFTLYVDQFEEESQLIKARNLIEAGLYPEKYELTLERLGGGNTTNILNLLHIHERGNNKVQNSYVLKSYKEFSERIEPRTLYVLVKNNFPNSPKIYGMVKIDGKETIGILENLKNKGNIGDVYWSELNHMINTLFKSLDDDFSTLDQKININEKIKTCCVESLKISEKIGLEIKKLHKALRLKGDSLYYREKVESKPYLETYSSKLTALVNEIQNDIRRSKSKTFYNSPKINSTLLDIKDIIQKFKAEFDVEYINIQPVHQDLHMQQILYNKTNDHFGFYFIDFEGDPQLTIEEKKARFPIEKDLGSFLRSLSYIKFQSLLNYIERKVIKREEFEVPEEVLFTTFFRKSAKITKSQKLLQILLKILNIWENKMMTKIFDKSLKLHFTLINYYTIERALNELKYELLFRPNKIIIPILGLKEIIYKEIS